jgi:hypothetical protein
MKPLLTTLILSFLILPLVSFAQNPNTIVPVSSEGVITGTNNGLVPCEGKFCSPCDLVVLANTGIKWLLTLSFLFFAILALRAGWKLIISQGNSGALTDAKQSFTNAFIGLIIIMVAWIFVDTLMRQLLDGGTGNINGYGPWSKVQCATQVDSTVSAEFYPGDPAFDPVTKAQTGNISGPLPTGCSGTSCVTLSTPCTNGCSVSSDIVNRINSMHQQAGVGGARVTEAMPPSRTHKSACHTNGTCVDYSKAGGMTAAEVLKVINAAKANNLRPVYEVATDAQKNSLVAGGVPAGHIKVLGSWITAPHFSIYGY